jgi:IS30 family transposase
MYETPPPLTFIQITHSVAKFANASQGSKKQLPNPEENPQLRQKFASQSPLVWDLRTILHAANGHSAFMYTNNKIYVYVTRRKTASYDKVQTHRLVREDASGINDKF